MNYLNPKEVWDSLADESRDAPLKAVISRKDVNNHYVDRLQKMLFNKVIRTRKDFKVLDVGCGVGRLTLWAAPRVERMVGVDLSPKMIEIAKKGANIQNLKNIEFFVIDGKSLPFEDEEFDLILVVWLLKYIIDESQLKSMIEEICRVTKEKGHIAMIGEVDDNGPTLLTREDFDGQALLRPSDYYVSLFANYGAKLIERNATHRATFLALYSAILKKLGLEKYNKIDSYPLKIVINFNLLFDILMRKRITRKGHQFFYFTKSA